MKNMRVLIAFAVAFLAAVGAAAQSESGRNVIIGVVYDGRAAGTDELFSDLREDLTSLLGSRYDIQIPADKALDAGWSAETASAHYDRLVQDADVDIIVVLGVLAVDAIASNQDYAKPVLILGVIEPERRGLPPVADNKSGVRNLTYVMINRSVDRDLDAFQEVFPYNKIGIVLYDELIRFLSADPDIFRNVMDKNQTSFEFVPMGADIENVLSGVSEDVDALYLGYLGPFEGETKGQLIDAINARGIPSFAWSAAEVDRGVLASIAPAADQAKIVRRISLNIEAILNGQDPADLPVNLTFEENLRLNRRTANKIGFAPTFAVLAKAELVDEFAVEGAPTRRLVDVMREAMLTNLNLKIEEQAVESTKKDVSLATTDYLPSLSLDASGVQVDKDRAENSGGQQPERIVTGGVAIEQLIFSEQVIGNISTQKHLLRASQYGYEGLRLDVVLEAATAYLNILRTKARRRIQQDNLDLTRRNLGIAKQRAAVGYSGQSDVYRWESRFYTANTELLAAKNDVELAKMQLNVTLNRPIDEVFVAEEAGFEESGYVDLRDGVQGYIDSPRSLQIYTDFLVAEAFSNSPEIQELNASIEALERSYDSLKRKPWIPTLGLRAEYQHVFARDGAGSRVFGIETNDDLWSVGLAAKFPLFLGGSTRVSARQANIEIRGLEEQRKQLHQAIEFDVRSAMLKVMVARVNLENAQRSAELSLKGLDLVQDEYAKGLASIVNLVDAQNEALSDNLNALSSEYEFLISVFNTDRAVGRFELLGTAEERQEFLNRFETYLSERNR